VQPQKAEASIVLILSPSAINASVMFKLFAVSCSVTSACESSVSFPGVKVIVGIS
jgi:hypothetical protein